MNPELSPSPRETPAVSHTASSLPHSISGTLPPLPITNGGRLSCFDDAWERLESVTLSNMLSERHTILQQERNQESTFEARAERAKALISKAGPVQCREQLLEFFRWQLETTPEAPLHTVSQLLHDITLKDRNALSKISDMAESIATSGFVDDKVASDALSNLHRNIRAQSPLSIAPSLISVALATAACHTLHPLLAMGSMVAAGCVIQAYRRAAWARQEYTIGYLEEVFDTHQALSRGEVPTIMGSLRSNFNWDRNERFRADGYMIARTLRLLEVPSSEIREAYAAMASDELENQPLIHLLLKRLDGINMKVSESLAADYRASHEKAGDLARVLDALNACYFTWGKRTARLYQKKMLELLTK